MSNGTLTPAEYKTAVYWERRRAGQCVRVGCDNKPEGTRVRCTFHLKEVRKHVNKLHETRTNNGKCRDCGKGKLLTASRCRRCDAKERKRMKDAYRGSDSQ